MRVALVDDYEVVVRGVAAMLRSYGDRVEIVELDLDRGAGGTVDITLYDTFANAQGDRKGVHQLAADPRAGRVAAYSWNTDADRQSARRGIGSSPPRRAAEEVGREQRHRDRCLRVPAARPEWPIAEQQTSLDPREPDPRTPTGPSTAEVPDSVHCRRRGLVSR
jgi:hypothetical protein